MNMEMKSLHDWETAKMVAPADCNDVNLLVNVIAIKD